MALSSIALPKPKNWQDFERHTCVLFACVLNDPTTQQNGRSGQKQHGVDIFGYRERRHDCLVGVQCKEKMEAQITEEELRAELDKAKNFKPPISEFILVTTAPRDQKIQEAARTITDELATTDQPIRVAVWGWEDIEYHASQHETAWNAFDPTYNPYMKQGFERLQSELQSLRKSPDRATNEIRLPTPNPTEITLDRNDNDTKRHGQITALQGLIDDGPARAALAQLLKLRNDEWATATRSERYRILVSIASANLKLGKYDEAGTLLVDAYLECPEHKNAEINRAKGYLLKNDHREAAKRAGRLLTDNQANADAAGILVQALIAERTCDDPLNQVPDALHEVEEVLIARICFLRSRSDSNWTTLAKTAAKKFPESRVLKLFSAEAIVDELTRANRDAIAGGIFHDIGASEFSIAVQELYSQARDAIDKGYALLPSTAQNAALALRLADSSGKAREILDAAIIQYPDDESLRLQLAIIAYSENACRKRSFGCLEWPAVGRCKVSSMPRHYAGTLGGGSYYPAAWRQGMRTRCHYTVHSRRLGLERAITSVCGPLYTTQSVIGLLAYRAFEAKESVGKKRGYIGWRNNQIVFQEFSDDVLKNDADERATELAWAKAGVAIVPAMPRKDFSQETRTTIDLVGHQPAIQPSQPMVMDYFFFRKTWVFERGRQQRSKFQPHGSSRC